MNHSASTAIYFICRFLFSEYDDKKLYLLHRAYSLRGFIKDGSTPTMCDFRGSHRIVNFPLDRWIIFYQIVMVMEAMVGSCWHNFVTTRIIFSYFWKRKILEFFILLVDCFDEKTFSFPSFFIPISIPYDGFSPVTNLVYLRPSKSQKPNQIWMKNDHPSWKSKMKSMMCRSSRNNSVYFRCIGSTTGSVSFLF